MQFLHRAFFLPPARDAAAPLSCKQREPALLRPVPVWPEAFPLSTFHGFPPLWTALLFPAGPGSLSHRYCTFPPEFPTGLWKPSSPSNLSTLELSSFQPWKNPFPRLFFPAFPIFHQLHRLY